MCAERSQPNQGRVGCARTLYKVILAPLLLLLGLCCLLVCLISVRNILNQPSLVAVVWTLAMAAASFLAFTNAFRAFTGRGRLGVEGRLEAVFSRFGRLPAAIEAVPVVGPPAVSAAVVAAATIVFVVAFSTLSTAIHELFKTQGIPALRGASLTWPLLDSNTRLVAVLLSFSASLVAMLILHHLFARPAVRVLAWTPSRAVATTYGLILIVAAVDVITGIQGLSPPIVAAAIPCLVVPGLSFWRLQRIS